MSENVARLVLDDGTVFTGKSFGFEGASAGELVFNTAMNGYPESLTDPSYRGQILVATFPLIGNYGVPADVVDGGLHQNWESGQVHIKGLVVSEYSEAFSHWNASMSLSQWLVDNRIPAITGVDTRAITAYIREKGAMLAKIVVGDTDTDWYNPNADDLVAQVTTKQKQELGNGKYRIVLVDCGVKHNIARCLLRRDTTVVWVPYNYDYSNELFDGVFISNGPGDPTRNTDTIEILKKVMDTQVPIMGICLGNQLMALATGAKTYKLPYGHRSHNQPVLLEGTDRCFITSQNHGYAIDMSTLADKWKVLFRNANDGTCEGIEHAEKPHFAVQFHPEASGGPTDTEFLFDRFIDLVKQSKGK